MSNKFKDRMDLLEKEINEKLPKFKSMAEAEGEGAMFHQDAFAADYQEEEYLLLGKAIKYLGLKGKSKIVIVGKNRETLDGE